MTEYTISDYLLDVIKTMGACSTFSESITNHVPVSEIVSTPTNAGQVHWQLSSPHHW